jgi:NADH-quinone oxidoreductase subunit H
MSVTLADTQFVESTGVWIAKSVIIFGFLLAVVPMILLLERKLLGRFQNRYGPNRVGPYGLLQPLADVLKLLGKEQSYPRTSIPALMALAPAISILTAVAAVAIIPFGDVKHGLGAKYGLYGIDVNIGVLYAFAFGSLAFYGLLLGGWASGSKYSFLGAMRSAAQLISYEVSLTLALVGVVMMAGSLSLVDIVKAQGEIWYAVPQLVGLAVFAVAGFAETNRAPFDLPEADAELVAGYNTEFGGMRFGSFFMAEYMNMIVISGVAAAMFLGGWMGPGPGYLDPLWMVLKMFGFIAFFIWIRATLPRLRYDQLMSFGWKVLLPVATLNLLATATVVALT